jgi:hypothetical protein
VSDSQNVQPDGAGGHCGSGAHPGGGRHPTGCSGQPGGVLKRHPTAADSPVWSVSIPAPVPPVNPQRSGGDPSGGDPLYGQAITKRQHPT